MPTQPYHLKDGTKVPGTTTVIGASLGWNKQQLMGWAYKRGKEGKNFREETKDACEIGTLAHAMAEAHVKAKAFVTPSGADPEFVKKALTAYEAFLMWEQMSQLVLLGSEIPLVSEEVRYGGTLDAVGRVLGKLALIDFKTSNHTYADHVIQVAAYRNLWEENHPDEPLEGGIHILRFGKEQATFAHYYMPRDAVVAEPWDAFKALRLLYDLKKPVEGLV